MVWREKMEKAQNQATRQYSQLSHPQLPRFSLAPYSPTMESPHIEQRQRFTMDEVSQKIALFIDADNAPAKKFEDVLSEVAKYGVVTIRKAYGN